MSLNAVYDPVLSRVRLTGTSLGAIATAEFQRSSTGVQWTTIRGAAARPVSGGGAFADDYEFGAGVTTYYRVRNPSGTVLFTTSIVASLGTVWLKSMARPFLNRPVTVVEHGPISRPSRGGTFEIIGRSFPVGVTDIAGSRRWSLTVKADTLTDADALEFLFASGDILLCHVPATGPAATVPGGYVQVTGDISRDRFGKESPRRWFTADLTEVAAPGPGVYGAPATWDTILADFATWNDVLAAFGTWNDVLNYVADPGSVIVP